MTREQIEKASVTMKESQNYHMSFEDAQDYISKCGFDIPWNDGDVFVDEREITRTVGNVLKWRINAVWHDAHEEPQRSGMLIASNEDGNYILCGPNNSNWKQTVKLFRIMNWAYIIDLLPERKGGQTMNLNELRDEAYSIAKANGWIPPRRKNLLTRRVSRIWMPDSCILSVIG